MNERFLFRGMCIVGRTWEIGLLIRVNDDISFIRDNKASHANYSHVYTNTIGQCTGLYDKNGKLIFEHDKIKDLAGFEYTAVMHNGSFGFWNEFKTFSSFEHCLRYNVMDFEVIGNIHEQ